ncbi:MAG: Maf family protein [Firmicutes bacterium]|nr:Maf family protein [Bacillota bacterium]
MNLILASASPRRAELLKQAGIPFSVEIPGIEEAIEKSVSPRGLVLKHACRKALAVSERCKEGYILSADTIVVLESEIMGKPADEKEASQMLGRLSGEKHEVFTGLALMNASTGMLETGAEVTSVWMKQLDISHIEAYIATGETFDKAGAYGIQGRAGLFIEKIEGCYTNVVGLPLGLLFDLISRMDVPIWLSRKDGDNAK